MLTHKNKCSRLVPDLNKNMLARLTVSLARDCLGNRKVWQSLAHLNTPILHVDSLPKIFSCCRLCKK